MPFSLPFGPSDVPWWVWLLGAGVAFFVCVLSAHEMELIRKYTPQHEHDLLGCGCLAFLSGIVAFLTGVVGIGKLAKWAWYG